MPRVTEEQVLDKLKHPPKCGHRLTKAEAQFLIELIENPPLTRMALKVLIDQAKRKRMQRNIDLDGNGRPGRPKAPVLDVRMVNGSPH